ncbi:MAG: hypothetical protein WC055_16210 [Melioribacteraceae bacterium]
MSDILSALSLFLAVLGLLYSAWYSEINSAVNEVIPKFIQDRKPVKDRITSAYYNKSLPLSFSGILISFIILPDFLRILFEVYVEFNKNGLRAISNYDSVKALFCAIFFLQVVFSIHLFLLARKLNELIKKCDKK